MKCVVTGGAGFIGSHLVDRLLDDGHEVVVIDNFAIGRRENLAAHLNSTRLKVVQADVTDLATIKPHFDGIDWVFHLAALADIVPSIESPIPYHRANVDGTVNVLEAARHANVQRFVYAASSSCYGIPDIYPTPETAETRPMYPYALTKYLGEQCVMHWCKVYKLPAVALRLFNVFGPRHRTTGTYGAVFGVFLAQKLAGKPFTVVGDGEQTRDFTFVTDVADAFVTAARSGISNEIFNVGSDNTYSVNRLIELLGGDKVHIPRRPGEPDCTHADISKIKRVLHWNPKVRFEDGVATMLTSIEQWGDAPLWTVDKIANATKDWFKYLGDDDKTMHNSAQKASN
ncbi:SDR family oxidoreductase [Bradyrhizobium canariense]|uniref:UDP-glucose 4-epimerase n=1 Tax=Bradyrhizobium canariense TaxID=255045 RepID=A0A1H1QHK3_9BRAD|nr:SDR family oxidoreductase [Bradyrhizobium canariense]SDS22797.1 UDP-glucose 4-epimerase [Bradyrhizobium canariense]